MSGGIDSMVMLDLFTKAGFPIGVVHCNFRLRGNDSYLDEQVVKDVCAEKIPFYSKQFDTKDYATEHKLSLQMAARELRYNFFNEVMKEQGYAVVATAHHLNDSFETALLNFVRGTGIDGMTGIPVQNGCIIRPLLFATRKMIHEYAVENALTWRNDASNESDDYQRNLLRNRVIPVLKEINPNLEETFRHTQERLEGSAQITRDFIDKLVGSTTGDSILTIKKDIILQSQAPAMILWEIVKGFGFNYEQAKLLVSKHQPGKIFHSSTHTITIDRESFIVGQKDKVEIDEVEIPKSLPRASNGIQELAIREVRKNDFTLSVSSKIAQLDLRKIKYPLLWRRWQPGDSFVPLGMRDRKKLSDFFIDLKVALPEKRKITVVESDGVIVWVVGFRIHDDYKITDRTDEILVLEQR